MKALHSIRTLLMAMLSLLFAGSTTRGFYNPTQGRWFNRDPIGEQGGVNVYAFARNDPVGEIDFLGLLAASVH